MGGGEGKASLLAIFYSTSERVKKRLWLQAMK